MARGPQTFSPLHIPTPLIKQHILFFISENSSMLHSVFPLSGNWYQRYKNDLLSPLISVSVNRPFLKEIFYERPFKKSIATNLCQSSSNRFPWFTLLWKYWTATWHAMCLFITSYTILLLPKMKGSCKTGGNSMSSLLIWQNRHECCRDFLFLWCNRHQVYSTNSANIGCWICE